MIEWWESFFDEDYLRIWGQMLPSDKSKAEAEAIWHLLHLSSSSRVLDAPCGQGRMARVLADRGAHVLGVDLSDVLLARAQHDSASVPRDRLTYLKHDLRVPLKQAGFDAALNVFSSLGYGSREDDLAILTTLSAAVRPGGLVLIETMHRDAMVARLSRESGRGQRLSDGTLLVELSVFDAIEGRVNTTWYWSGPGGAGEKRASIRMYTATELVRLSERAGLRFRSAYHGLSLEPFRAEGASMGGHIALITERSRSA